MTKIQFSNWLAGFIDGEGNFQVFIDRDYLRVAFRIVLHVDDVETLNKIHSNFLVSFAHLGRFE